MPPSVTAPSSTLASKYGSHSALRTGAGGRGGGAAGNGTKCRVKAVAWRVSASVSRFPGRQRAAVRPMTMCVMLLVVA